jgi:hypothetical protein
MDWVGIVRVGPDAIQAPQPGTAMGVFDQAARFATQADPVAVTVRTLASSKSMLPFKEWADTRTLAQPGRTERTADLVAWLEEPAAPDSPWLLLLEFQAQHDPEKLDVTLEMAARLRVHARHGQDRRARFRVMTGLIYLQGRCPETLLDMTLPEGFGTRHQPLIWNIEEEEAEATLTAVVAGQVSWGMLFWVPLMAGGDAVALIARWKETIMAIEDRTRRGDLGKIALIFAELAGRYVAWEKALEGVDMTESKVVNSWIKEAVDKKSLEKSRNYLLHLLNKRFPNQVTPEVTETINSQPSETMLVDWYDRAFEVETIADFVKLLRT